MRMKLNSLDIGCGFSKGEHKKKGEIGIDLNRGICDVVADAQNLPFRNEVFDKIVLYSVLEHLDNPLKCLRECVRVAKQNARFEIEIPVKKNLWVELTGVVTEFPFGIFTVIKRRLAERKFGKCKGYFHRNHIQPHDISRFFKINKQEIRVTQEHAWFSGRKGRILKKIFRNLPRLGRWKNWYIEAHKSPEST